LIQDEKVALITGAAQRIGAAIARELHASGCRVIAHYRASADAATKLAHELNTLRPDSCRTIQADLATPGAAAELAKRALACWNRLDLLINNASGFFPTPLARASDADWESLFGSNLKGPFFLCQALAPELRARHGAIVNLVDVHGELPLRHHSIYTMAKAGVAMMTRALALELAPEVRVNGVAPGAILWPVDSNPEHSPERAQELLAQTALKRLGDPTDIARAVRYLGLEAGYVTGQILAVDGGRTLY
jgi:pteridine reductase